MKLQSGHEIIPLDNSERTKQGKDFRGFGEGFVRLNPGRWLYPAVYQKLADRFYNFKFKSSDVAVMTWPKCGTTWMQEIIWTMRNNPKLDNINADNQILLRSPFLEMDLFLPSPKPGDAPPEGNPFVDAFQKMCSGKSPADGLFLQIAEALPDPRTIKTHLPFSLLSPSLLDTCKVVYVARNPKDVVVSYHHHTRFIKSYDYVGSFEDFVQYFVDDDLVYGPYWQHLKEAWERKDHPNFHLIFFEDLKANLLEEIRKLNAFLDTDLSENQLTAIAEYTSFSEMKSRDTFSRHNNEEIELALNKDIMGKEGGFFRKGEVGDWRNKLTPELDAKIDKWIRMNVESLGINFKFNYGV